MKAKGRKQYVGIVFQQVSSFKHDKIVQKRQERVVCTEEYEGTLNYCRLHTLQTLPFQSSLKRDDIWRSWFEAFQVSSSDSAL